ncbi:MAG: lipase [Actinobacteria bacterium]|nr:lipase [Actinomycetota bacterium]
MNRLCVACRGTRRVRERAPSRGDGGDAVKWSALSPVRRRFAAVTGAVIVAAAGVVVGLAVTGGGDSDSAVSQDVLGPIVLVPGYGGSTTGLDSLAASLRTSGRTVEVFDLPDGGTGDLRVQARALGVKVRAVLAATGDQSVDLVGYSAGGVVARVWLRDDGGVPSTRRLVMLGSPQHGTQLAALGGLVPGACPTACQQLAAGSDLLDGLNAGDETPPGLTYVSVYTTHDDVVVPPQSAELTGALNVAVQSVCAASTVDHTQLPTDPDVQRIVADELQAGPPRRLGPSDCSRVSS